MKTICFDKTGTLTEDSFGLDKVFIYDEGLIKTVGEPSDLPKTDLGKEILIHLSTCHSLLKKFENILGDNLDKEIF